jgi:hypothetical protein
VQKSSPGIAARLLSKVHISHTVYVTDSANGFGGGSGGGVACGVLSLAAGFPPTGVYQLVLTPQSFDVMVAPGKRPVYYHRRLVPTGQQIGWGRPFSSGDLDQYRLEYLASLSYLPLETITQALTPRTTIRWTNAGRYQNEVANATSGQRLAIEHVLHELQNAGALTPDETAALQLSIMIEPEDQRQTGEALPDLPPVPVREN